MKLFLWQLTLVAIMLPGPVAAQPSQTEFRGFLRSMVHEVCYSNWHRATQPLATYFRQHDITDPVALLTRDMNAHPDVSRLEDTRLRAFARADLAQHDADAVYVFSKRYFNWVVSSCELRVVLYRKADKVKDMSAYVFHHRL